MEALTAARTYWFARWFSEESSFWTLAITLTTILSFLKGFRIPGTWAATQAQIDYRGGFVRRGLFGATVTRLFHLERYLHFAIFSTAVLLLLMGLLFAFAAWAGAGARFGRPVVAAVFGASYCTTFLAHLNGYFDVLLAALTVGLLFADDVRRRAALAPVVIGAGLLLHEMFLVVFLPTVLVSFALQAAASPAMRERRVERRFALGTVAVLAAFGVSLTLVLARVPVRTSAAQLGREVAARVDFPVREDVFEVLTRSAGDNRRIMAEMVRRPYWRSQQMASAVIFAPSVALFLALTRTLLRRSAEPLPRWCFPACAGAGLAPLLMNGLGWDAARWWALATLTTFLVLCVSCRFVPGAAVPMAPATLRVACLVMALSLASGGVLMDNRQIDPFPFFTTGIHNAFRLQSVPL